MLEVNDDNLIRDFVAEALEHLAGIENDLLAIEAAGAQSDPELVNKVFRAVHSIKGAAGFFGLTRISELAHGLESVLNLVRHGDLAVAAGVTDVLLKGVDLLRTLLNHIHESEQMEIGEAVRALQKLVVGEHPPLGGAASQAQVTVHGGPHGDFCVSAQALTSQRRLGHHLYALAFDLVNDVEAKGRMPMQLIRELVALGEIVSSRMAHAEWGDLSAPLPSIAWFQVLFGSALEPALVAEAFELPADRVVVVEAPADPATEAQPAPASAAAPPAPVAAAPPPPQVTHPPASVAPPPPPTAPARPAGATAAPPAANGSTPLSLSATPADSNVRVAVALLDQLMNLAGELVLARNQLVQALNSQRYETLPATGAQVSRITSALHEAIMQTRMQPVGNVFAKFPRVVRDLAAQLGKDCALALDGQEVELDKSLIEAIADPLLHLVRNAVDHGLESTAERTARGKDAVGHIALRARHQAGKVLIEVQDDGGGIDVARVREKAVAQGLLTPEEARGLGEREVLQLIFRPGFSTAGAVTSVSGRGVGMDVVKTNVERIGGSVDIATEAGVGTTIRIKLPLTLAIVPSLIVRSGAHPYAIPQVSISELIRVRPGEARERVQRIKSAEVLRLRGELLPLLRLNEVLGMPGDAANAEGDEQSVTHNILVLESGHLKYGLVVDALFDSEEIVVKPLGAHVKHVRCLAGATILGNGNVAMILDPAGIAVAADLKMPKTSDTVLGAASAALSDEDTQSILLFTNDPTEVFACPMGPITRIEGIRTDQIDTVGDQIVLQYRGSTLPLLALEDQIHARPRPELSRVYVIVFSVAGREVGLIAPRLVDIREIPREFDATTFVEPGVLGSVIVDSRTTRLVDLWALARHAHPEWFNAPAGCETATRAQRRVLFAEDSDFFRHQVTSFMEGDGYEVVACPDGASAWQALEESEQPFDVVVTDIEMPVLDGLALTRRIREDRRFAHLPVIAVTSLASEEDEQRGQAAGVSEYQVKLNRDLLLEAVRRHANANSAAQPATLAGAVGSAS